MTTKSIFVVLVNSEGKILLIHNRGDNGDGDRPFRKPPGYGLPGGRVEEGEDEFAAAVREVKEETGYTIKIDPASAMRSKKSNGHENIVVRGYPLDAEQLESPPQPTGIGVNEIDDYSWVLPQDILANKIPGIYKGHHTRILDFIWRKP